jgi:hypothetical protein
MPELGMKEMENRILKKKKKIASDHKVPKTRAIKAARLKEKWDNSVP